jgi:hypothetical protein
MFTESNNHSPAIFQMNSGIIRPGNPSLGSWVTYGLGSSNENLPAFIVMYDWRGGPLLVARPTERRFHASGLPGNTVSRHWPADCRFAATARKDPHLQRRQVDFVEQLNREHLRHNPGNF